MARPLTAYRVPGMNYLIVSLERCECEGCNGDLEPGIVGMSDEVVAGGRVVAQCRTCLAGLDPLLSAAWHCVIGYGRIADHETWEKALAVYRVRGEKKWVLPVPRA